MRAQARDRDRERGELEDRQPDQRRSDEARAADACSRRARATPRRARPTGMNAAKCHVEDGPVHVHDGVERVERESDREQREQSDERIAGPPSRERSRTTAASANSEQADVLQAEMVRARSRPRESVVFNAPLIGTRWPNASCVPGEIRREQDDGRPEERELLAHRAREPRAGRAVTAREPAQRHGHGERDADEHGVEPREHEQADERAGERVREARLGSLERAAAQRLDHEQDQDEKEDRRLHARDHHVHEARHQQQQPGEKRRQRARSARAPARRARPPALAKSATQSACTQIRNTSAPSPIERATPARTHCQSGWKPFVADS